MRQLADRISEDVMVKEQFFHNASCAPSYQHIQRQRDMYRSGF